MQRLAPGQRDAWRAAMYRVCIAIVDAARARLFQFERTADPGGLHDQLTELRDLVDPARRQRPSELFSDSGPSADHSGQHGFAFDDHRDEHLAHLDADFARSIVAELAQLAVDADRLIVCASPRMLGQLRDSIGTLQRPDLVIDEVPRDLVKLTPAQLREQLATYGLLPTPLPRPPLAGRA
ncbi:MAG TPA: host attachment protein [Kofleriaceae bacterium]|nr:host attachment protein [Kofleriaceae bacterium]